MVEDLNYARSVRDSGGLRGAGAIGIATITSIAVGVLAVLAFICLVFLALARRRRAIKAAAESDDSMSALPISTPTQSRTTYSPPPPGTPSAVGIPPDR